MSTEATSPEAPQFKTGFIILVNSDDQPVILADLEPGVLPIEQNPNVRQIRRILLELVADFQSQAVVDSVAALLSKTEPTPAEIVSEALAKRAEA